VYSVTGVKTMLEYDRLRTSLGVKKAASAVINLTMTLKLGMQSSYVVPLASPVVASMQS